MRDDEIHMISHHRKGRQTSKMLLLGPNEQIGRAHV